MKAGRRLDQMDQDGSLPDNNIGLSHKRSQRGFITGIKLSDSDILSPFRKSVGLREVVTSCRVSTRLLRNCQLTNDKLNIPTVYKDFDSWTSHETRAK